MRILKDERGQVLVMTVLSMMVLMGVMALAMDMGTLFRARRNMQIAADAAAMAGATEIYYNATSAQIQSAVYAAALANGVDHTVTGNTVTISGPGVTLASGLTCATCLKAQVATPNPTFFMSLFTGAHTTNVAAMAVAGAPGIAKGCGYVDENVDKALWIHGAGAIKGPDCGIYVESTQPDALCVTGSAGKSTFPWVDVKGGQPTNGNCGGSLASSTQVNLNQTNVPSDPFVSTLGNPANDPANQCSGGNTTTVAGGQLTGTIAGPGYGNVQCYTYSVTSGKGKSQTTTLTPVTLTGATMGPGVYVFLSGVDIEGTDVVGNGTPAGGTSGNGGAMIEIADPTGTNAATYTQGTSSSLTIYAAADATSIYNGVALMESTDESTPMQISFGSSGEVFDGMIYAPTAAVSLHDEGGTGVTTKTDIGFVVGTLEVNGTLDVDFTNYSTANPTTTPFKLVTLVE